VPLFAVFFVLGGLALHRLAELPPLWVATVLVAVLAAVGVIGLNRLRLSVAGLTILTMVGGALSGFCWAHVSALWHAPPVIPGDSVRHDLVLEGTIKGLPQVRGRLSRMVFAAESIALDDRVIPGEWRFRLSWHDAPSLRPGERWSLPVRIKAASGYASPGAWDYEGWLYRQGIRYTGYVKDRAAARRLAAATGHWVDRLRATLSERLAGASESEFTTGVLRALVVADRSGLTTEARNLFRDTGTSHLMAVSGLHIGLVSGAIMLLAGGVWRRVPRFCALVPARIAAASAGLIAAFGYAALAGFGLPTQRALIMLGVLVVAILGRREPRPLNGLAIAAVLVLAWHPPSVLDAGFWLSFAAVLAIFAALAWTRHRSRWVQAMMVQAVITVALSPVLLVYELPVSALSPLVNLLLVPLFAVAVVPGSLVGGLLALGPEGWAGLWFVPMTHLLGGIETALQWAAEQNTMLPTVAGVVPMLLGMTVLLMLAPPGVPLRWIGLPLFVLPWLPRADHVAPGTFHFHLLDVGQGLAVVIETHRHVLVFDTGPAYPSGFSTAGAVIVPFLRQLGHQRIDRLIVSHSDIDHAGGTAELQQALPVAEILSGEPNDPEPWARPCTAGMDWNWDGVRFRILHPPTDRAYRGNNASCVLRIDNAAGSVLLTGDIEATVELHLLASVPGSLDVDVVVASHHGSSSSSTARFVDATDADHVLFAAGWANRYGFPDPEVVARWTRSGAQAWNTAHWGSLSMRFEAEGSYSEPVGYRQASRRFWQRHESSADPGLAVSSGEQIETAGG
jgi:competence protein ComEC